MTTARLRRLQSDYEAVRRLARLHPHISIDGVQGNPPERYRLVLRVASLRERGTAVESASEHTLEVVLGHGYPRDAPVFRMLTPVFHPNIAPHAVCIGDHWAASESLDLLIQRVGEMLAFQSYNIKSPLNGRAAQWVEEHPGSVPTEVAPFFIDLADLAAPADAQVQCANCRAPSEALRTCAASHGVCGDCSLVCETCMGIVCLACGDTGCKTCHATCSNCRAPAIAVTCAYGHPLCEDCGATCGACGHVGCVICGFEHACAAHEKVGREVPVEPPDPGAG